MKQYKLIKTYPNSPELNTVVVFNKATNKYLTIKGGLHFKVDIIEDSPEFWQKIESKAYQILEYKTAANHCYKLDETTGKYKALTDNKIFDATFIETNFIYKILSVKRLSDGEIFTIGDKVNNGYSIVGFTCSKIYTIHNDIGIKTEDINDLLKQKTPLFTTGDGVDIFEETKIYGISVNDWKPFSYTVREKVESVHPIFSTKEAAEKYILMHIPCLSINDINSIPVWDNLVDDLVRKVNAKLTNF